MKGKIILSKLMAILAIAAFTGCIAGAWHLVFIGLLATYGAHELRTT